MTARDEIRLDDLELDCIVGIYPEERRTPQPLVASVALRLDLEAAARTSDLGRSLDYAHLARELAWILETARFRLLESAALTLLAHALTPLTKTSPRPEEGTVRLIKPRALSQVKGAAIPSVAITRAVAEIVPQTAKAPSGMLTVLYDGPEASVFRAPAPAASWPFAGDVLPPLPLADGSVLVVCRRS